MINPINERAQGGEPTGGEPTGGENGKPKQARLMCFSDALSVAVADAEAANAARMTGKPRGPITGFKILDTELGGAFAPGPHSINGDPGAGKTAFALQIAATCHFPALFVTCEMSPAELLRRQAARVTGTFLGKFKSGELTPHEARELLSAGAAAAPQLALLDATQAPATVPHIEECARITKGDANGLLIVIDSLHSWAEGAVDGNEYEVLNAAIAGIRNLAHGLNCPVIYIAERNRASMGAGGQNAGAGSRKIEYGAETVISLNRDKDAKPDGAGETPITLKLDKNRHGTVGKSVNLTFNGALQRFKAGE